MNWNSHLTYVTARALHEERVERLQRSWGPSLTGTIGAALRRRSARRAAARARAYDLAA
ncbi:hypothetical protein [Kineosporia sp. A_224]|uniref:hypothetical protein n=1 Tax=Kineosporia sp. A_224 TaxID=1962180 RepID=UPI00130465DC|nr:hypothetical protein [Kineosporia sp. A_224]